MSDIEQILEEREALRVEVQRLSKFEHWVRMHGRHAEFCPAKLTEKPWKGPPGTRLECTCGLETLRCSKPVEMNHG